MKADDRLTDLRAEALAIIEQLEVDLMATKMKPRAQRLDAVVEVGARIDAAAEVVWRVLGEET